MTPGRGAVADPKDDHEKRSDVEGLVAGIRERFGIDCREYAPGSFERRILGQAGAEGLRDIASYGKRVFEDPGCLDRLLLSLASPARPMFHRPSFYRALRDRVTPALRTYPSVNVWCAGCSTGEQAYEIAITLAEEGLGERARVYATDVNEVALGRATEGVYPIDAFCETDYLAAGGKHSFADYFTVHGDRAAMVPSLRDRITFAQHGLLTDASFNEFQLILCRNVMVDFDGEVRRRIFGLFHESLCLFGVLGVGEEESVGLHPYRGSYEKLDCEENLYRRVE